MALDVGRVLVGVPILTRRLRVRVRATSRQVVLCKWARIGAIERDVYADLLAVKWRLNMSTVLHCEGHPPPQL